MNDVEYFNQQKELAKAKHEIIREVLSNFPESKHPIILIGTISTAYNMQVDYVQDGNIIVIQDK